MRHLLTIVGWASACLTALAGLSTASGQPTDSIRTLRESPIVDQRISAAASLAAAVAAKHPQAIEALAAAVKSDPVPSVRRAAVLALGSSPDCAPVDAALQAAARDASETVRAAAQAARDQLRCAAFMPDKPVPPKYREGTAAVSRSRLIYGTTAHEVPAGTASWNIVNIGAWQFSYALPHGLEISVLTGPPVTAVAVSPSLRWTFGTERLRGGVLVQAGGLFPYLESMRRDVSSAWIVGGGAFITAGGRDHFFNIGVYGYGAGVDSKSDGAMLITLGGSLRLSQSFRFNVEGWLPVVPSGDKPVEFGLIMYGLRIDGDRIYGSVGFAVPIASGMWDVLKYIPLGIPVLQFGFTW